MYHSRKDFPDINLLFIDDGISIPCEYTSYVAPMMSMKLHTETGMCKEPGKSPEVLSLITLIHLLAILKSIRIERYSATLCRIFESAQH